MLMKPSSSFSFAWPCMATINLHLTVLPTLILLPYPSPFHHSPVLTKPISFTSCPFPHALIIHHIPRHANIPIPTINNRPHVQLTSSTIKSFPASLPMPFTPKPIAISSHLQLILHACTCPKIEHYPWI